MSATMQAVLADQGLPKLVEVPVPTPGPGQVLVEVHAAGMNRADLLHVKGRYGQRAFAGGGPDIAGMEMAGRVVALGETVASSWLHTRVMAMSARCYAEYVVVDERLLLPVPEQSEWSQAATLPMALMTEFEALVRLGAMRPESRVMLTGATSGVAMVGLQLARARGCEYLVATSRNSANAELLTSLGADALASTPEEMAGLAGPGYDLVIDHVGGEWCSGAVEHLRTGARIVSVGRLGARSVPIDLTALAGRRAQIIGTTWKTQELTQMAETVTGVRAEVLPLVQAGQVQSVVAQSVPVAEVAEAYRLLEGSHAPGKIAVVLRPD